MSNDELKYLTGEVISMNSFLSTTIDRTVALFYLDESSSQSKLQRVLFEIDADPGRDGVKSFADISSLSYFKEEKEVLMMLGSIYRLTEIFLGETKCGLFE